MFHNASYSTGGGVRATFFISEGAKINDSMGPPGCATSRIRPWTFLTNVRSQGNVYCYYNNVLLIPSPESPDDFATIGHGRLVYNRLINGYLWFLLWLINIIDGYRRVSLSHWLNFKVYKVEALWFGCYGVIIWFLSGKNESEWFLVFSFSDICLCYSCAQFSVCVLRKLIITKG